MDARPRSGGQGVGAAGGVVLASAGLLGRATAWLGKPALRRWPSLVRSDLIVAAVFLMYQAALAPAFAAVGTPDSPPRTSWDGHLYAEIAASGYPRGGSPGSSPEGFGLYAFHPLFPALVRVAAAVTGLRPAALSPWVSLAAATIAVVVLSHWLRPLLGGPTAFGAVLALMVWPASPVLQMGYTEGLAVLLLVMAWRFIAEARPVAGSVVVLLLGLARPLAPVLLVVLAVEGWSTWRRRDRQALRSLAAIAVAALASVALWPAFAGVISGDPGVYWAAHMEFADPGKPGSLAALALESPAAALLLVLFLALIVLWGLGLMSSATPRSVRTWVVIYPVYLAIGALIVPALLRYLLLEFPLGLALGPLLARRVWGPLVIMALVAAGLFGGWWWVHEFVGGGGRTYP